jgi:hypothetical protein
MACVLTRRQNGVFEVKTGKTVEIGLRSERPMKLVRLAYAGKGDGEAPFTFTIVSGPQKLLIVALGAGKAVQLMRIVEDPEGDACHLRNFFWSATNFFTSLDIEGV